MAIRTDLSSSVYLPQTVSTNTDLKFKPGIVVPDTTPPDKAHPKVDKNNNGTLNIRIPEIIIQLNKELATGVIDHISADHAQGWIQENKPVVEVKKHHPSKITKIIKDADSAIKENNIIIPLDQIKTLPDLAKYVKDEVLHQKGEINIPQDILDKVGIKTPEQIKSFIEQINKSGVDTSKSKINFGYNQQNAIYQASFGNEQKSITVGASNSKVQVGGALSTEKEIEQPDGRTKTEKKEYEFSGLYNNGNLKRLADGTPENEQKFKTAVKDIHNSITEPQALKLRQDLISADSPKERKEVLESFIKEHGKKDSHEFLTKLGLEEPSIKLETNIDGKKTEIEISKEELKAAFEANKNGGSAQVGNGSVKLKAKVDGKEQEIEISRSSFMAAFEVKEVGGKAEFSKDKVDLKVKIGGRSAEIEFKKDELRLNFDTKDFGMNVRAVRKREEGIEIKDGNYIYTSGKENGGGAGLKASAKRFGVKGDFDLNYKTSVKIVSPAGQGIKDEKNIPEADKIRLANIAGQVSEGHAVSAETAQKLKTPETVTVSYERKVKTSAGLEYNGVSADFNREGKKDDTMSVTAIVDNDPTHKPPHTKVKVNIKIDCENTIEGSLGGSGVTLSAKKSKDNKLEVEFECDSSTQAGKEAYEQAVSGMKEGKLPIQEMSDNKSLQGFRSGFENKTTITKGLNTPITSHTLAKGESTKLDISSGNTEYTSSRATTQEGKALFDKEKKVVSFQGTVNPDHSLSGEATISFKIEDKKVRNREVGIYGDRTGLGVSLLDLKGQRNVSIDVNLKINHDNLQEISNKPIPADASKSQKAFLESMKSAKTDEDKLIVLQGYIEENGQKAFSFIQKLEVLAPAEMKLVGQKSTQLIANMDSKSLDKKIDDASKSSHPKHNLKQLRTKQETVKEKADSQIEYLQQFLQDNPQLAKADKEKINNSIQDMLNISLEAQANIDKINLKI